MAMQDIYKKCENCSEMIRAEQSECSSCGHKQFKPMSLPLAVGIALMPFLFSWFTLKEGFSKKARVISFGWLIIATIIAFGDSNHSKSQTEEIKNSSIENDSASNNKVNNDNWLYSQEFDKMRRKTSYWAICSSSDIKDFGFPYNKVQQQIIIRKQPSDGLNVLLVLTEGQYSCGFDGCQIQVKFDESPIKYYNVSRSKDRDGSTLFVSSKSDFLKKVLSSKKVLIESDYFQHGAETFEFKVSGLKWSY